MSQSQAAAVNRLTTMGFVFLPLSFVAVSHASCEFPEIPPVLITQGIFGITTFTGKAYWYPVAAVPTLLLTLFLASSIHSFMGKNQTFDRRSLAPNSISNPDAVTIPVTSTHQPLAKQNMAVNGLHGLRAVPISTPLKLGLLKRNPIQRSNATSQSTLPV
jgi:hypothetical protein